MAKKIEPKSVKVKILPLRGIGGYGTAGDEVWMPQADAEKYAAEGYCRVLDEAPVVVQSEVNDVPSD